MRAPPSPRPGLSAASAGSRRSIPTSTCCSTPLRGRIRWNRAPLTRSFAGAPAIFPASPRRSSSRRMCFRSARRPGSRPPHAAASRVESGISVVADLVRLAQGGQGPRCRGPARRLVQQHGDGDPRRGARAGGGAELVCDRGRRTRRRPPCRALLHQRPDALRLLLPLPPGRSGKAAHQGLARVSGRGSRPVGGRAQLNRVEEAAPRAAQFWSRSRLFNSLSVKNCPFDTLQLLRRFANLFIAILRDFKGLQRLFHRTPLSSPGPGEWFSATDRKPAEPRGNRTEGGTCFRETRYFKWFSRLFQIRPSRASPQTVSELGKGSRAKPVRVASQQLSAQCRFRSLP